MHFFGIEIQTSTVLWISLATILLIWYLQYQWNRRHMYELSEKVHGPKGWPVIGNILDFTSGSGDFCTTLVSYFTRYPNLNKFWYGQFLVYGVSDPEYLESVLTSPNALSKMFLYKHIQFLFGQGLFTASVLVWKRHRKIINSAFNSKILDGFVEIFGRHSSVMVQKLEAMVGKKDFDVMPLANKSTLDAVCETVMGVRVDSKDGESDFETWIKKMLKITFLRVVVPKYYFDFTFKWTRLYQESLELREKFYAFTSKAVNEKLASFASSTNESNNRKTLLDHLIQFSVGEIKLTKDQIRDEVNTFMIAGSDTTATTLGFLFLMLGMHKDIQNKVYEEVIQVLGLDRLVEAQDLPQLKYTERVIKETLRLFPVGSLIGRDVTEDIPLKNGLVLAKGSSVIFGIIVLHRNADIWPNPLKFDPDRFLPEEVAKRHPYAYLPFSGGIRKCSGLTYAIMSLKTTIATVIRKIQISSSYKSVEEIELKTNVVLRVKGGFKISVKLRN